MVWLARRKDDGVEMAAKSVPILTPRTFFQFMQVSAEKEIVFHSQLPVLKFKFTRAKQPHSKMYTSSLSAAGFPWLKHFRVQCYT